MSDLGDIVAQVWARVRPTALERIDLIAAAGRLVSDDDAQAELRAREAAAEAHKLAGTLGTYGHPDASRLAAEVEELLEGPLTAAVGERVVDIAGRMRDDLS